MTDEKEYPKMDYIDITAEFTLDLEEKNIRLRDLLEEALDKLYHLRLYPADANYANEIIEKIEKEMEDKKNDS